MKKYLVAALMTIGLAGTAQAQPTPPDEVVKKATAELQTLINKNHVQYKADLAAFYRTVDEVVVPHFDVQFIAKSVLARNWKGASEEQRKRFADAFKTMLIRSYANALLEYHDSVKAEWKPLRRGTETEDVTVNSSLLREGKPPVAIGFNMHLSDGQWRIYDITVENISLVTNFRGQINAELKRSDLDGVITRMETGQYAAPKPTAETSGG